MRKMAVNVLSVFLILTVCCFPMFSYCNATSDYIVEGVCGRNMFWRVDTEKATLEIWGIQDMINYDDSEIPPWMSHKDRIRHIIVEDGPESVGTNAFAGMDLVETVVLGSAVKKIGNGAFRDMASLSTFALPESLLSVGDRAFEGCTALEILKIPASVTDIGINAIPNGVIVDAENQQYCSDAYGSLYSKDLCALWKLPVGFNGSFAVPKSIVSIESCAFKGCTGLTSLIFGKHIADIGVDAFVGCTALKEVYFDGDAPCAVVENYATEIGLESDSAPTFYFRKDAQGWELPSWNSIPTAIWDEHYCRNGSNCAAYRFADMPTADNWAHAGIDFAVNAGLFNGTAFDRFSPDGLMTRGMLVTVLWRYCDKPDAPARGFTDVYEKMYYSKAIDWAASEEIVFGIGNNCFAPDDNITRQQMAAILFRFANYLQEDTSLRGDFSEFSDAENVSDYAIDPFKWTVAEGIIVGSNGCLLPAANATRAQVATILTRFIQGMEQGTA